MADRERNSFDLVRLSAAFLVFFSHSWPLATGSNSREPLMRLSGDLTLGAVGVDIFFVISGYLIAQSWARDPSLRRFAAKRARRILPGLIFAVGWTMLLLPALAGVGHSYLFDRRTWQYARAATLLLPWSDRLPGVFVANPYPGVINGSLWTLQLEVLCYALLAGAGLAGLFRRRPILLGLASAALAVQLWATLGHHALRPLPYINSQELLRLAIFFAAGTTIFLYREAIRWSPLLGAICVVVWLLACSWGYGFAASFLLLPYPVLLVATGLGRGVRLKNDISYRIYVFAFPLEQLVAGYLGPRVTPGRIMLLALPLVVAMASVSWFAVERRFLRQR